jgi:hypothetical protein
MKSPEICRIYTMRSAGGLLPFQHSEGKNRAAQRSFAALNNVARIARNLAGALALAKRKKPRLSGNTLLAGEVGRPAFIFDDGDVVRLLKTAVEREGNQSAFAKRHGVERSRLNRTLQGKLPVGRAITKALGLRRVYTAE